MLQPLVPVIHQLLPLLHPLVSLGHSLNPLMEKTKKLNENRNVRNEAIDNGWSLLLPSIVLQFSTRARSRSRGRTRTPSHESRPLCAPKKYWHVRLRETTISLGSLHNSVDSSVLSILPPLDLSPKQTIYAFINLYLNYVMWKRRKYTKSGRDWPIL